MKDGIQNSGRRDFLKSSVVGAAVLAAGNTPGSKIFAGTNAWSPGTPVNPNIDDKRVVYIKDSSMITAKPDFSNWIDQNSKLNYSKINTNMDKMACALAGISTPSAAWAKIFMKPSAKQWNQCKVYIKVNAATALNMPHVPIVIKVCQELINLGVTPSNIQIADPSRNARKPISEEFEKVPKFETYEGGGTGNLPAGVIVRNEEYPRMGDKKDAANLYRDRIGYSVPAGANNKKVKVFVWTGTQGNVSGQIDVYATPALATATNPVTYPTDIIVNIASNKGHADKVWMGGSTLTMKNHVGTFALHVTGSPTIPTGVIKEYCPGAPFTSDWTGDLSVGTSKLTSAMAMHETIMGGGTAAYPCRQQLCIVDSIWASKVGPHEPFDSVITPPAYIVMGTSSPWVDYQVLQKIRIAEMKVNVTADQLSVFTGYLKDYGFSDPSAGTWINAGNVPVDSRAKASSIGGMLFTLLLTGKASQEAVRFNLPESAQNSKSSVQIFDLRGKMVRDLGPIVSSSAAWDGRTNSGRKIATGRYEVRVTSGSKMFSKSITIMS